MKFRLSFVVLAAMTVAACSDVSKSPTGIASAGATDAKLWLGPARQPVITYTLTGTQLPSGWFGSDVVIDWSISDPDGALLSTEGCVDETLTTDTRDYTFHCHLESVVGPTTYEVGVMRDATPPIMTVSGNLGTFTVDQTVNITCTASDATSGVGNTDCGSRRGDALWYGVGEHIYIITSTDNAGNSAPIDYIRFKVVVTPDGVCGLAKRWFNPSGVANGLCQALKNGSYDAFRKKVEAQIGKSIPAETAAILISLSNAL